MQKSTQELHIGGYYSKGLHPWFLKSNTLSEEIKDLEDQINDDSFLAIGECGLDKLCTTDFELQLEAFEKQIALAEKYHKPLILHCVKAFNELISQRKKSRSKQVWIVHGFNGSPQLAKQLIELGMFISYGINLSRFESKAYQYIEAIPKNRLFLETDISEKSIEDIYSIASARLGISLDQLKNLIWTNYKAIFF